MDFGADVFFPKPAAPPAPSPAPTVHYGQLEGQPYNAEQPHLIRPPGMPAMFPPGAVPPPPSDLGHPRAGTYVRGKGARGRTHATALQRAAAADRGVAARQLPTGAELIEAANRRDIAGAQRSRSQARRRPPIIHPSHLGKLAQNMKAGVRRRRAMHRLIGDPSYDDASETEVGGISPTHPM